MVDTTERRVSLQPPVPEKYSKRAPFGVILLQIFTARYFPNLVKKREFWYQMLVLGITYFSYMNYHLTRKPLSVVKPILHRNCTGVKPEPGQSTAEKCWCCWKPFHTNHGKTLLGILDSGFTGAYAIGLFLSGMIADRMNARHFLFGGMLGGSFTCFLFGLGRVIKMHNFWYFMCVQIASGFVHSSGWPGTVAVVGRWCPAKSRGLIFGVWTSQTAVGNILGTLIAAWSVEGDWSKSFFYPALFFFLIAIVLFLFLPEYPAVVDCFVNIDEEPVDEEAAKKQAAAEAGDHKAVSFIKALLIPGVIEFSGSLFFAKLVAYVFMFWLPMFIENSTPLGPAASGRLTIAFDIGGAAGAAVAGYMSDYTAAPAVVCVVFYILAIPFTLLYSFCGSLLSFYVNGFVLVIVGLFVNGPYCLITTAVSAALGTHPSLNGNRRALATVTAIINGTGSIGSCFGPLIAGFISSVYGWSAVFYMLIVCDILGFISLLRLSAREVKILKRKLIARKQRKREEREIVTASTNTAPSTSTPSSEKGAESGPQKKDK